MRQSNTQVSFKDTGDGFYNIVFRHSGKCVHVNGGGRENGTNITQWDGVNQSNLKWRFALAAKTPYDFVDKPINVAIESGVAGGWYLHVTGGKIDNGTNISVWSWVDQPNLKWRIKCAEQSGYYYIVSALDQHCDHVVHQQGASHTNGDNVTLWERVNQGNTQVKFEDAGQGYFHIVFAHSGKCVHLHGGKGQNDANITQWDSVNQPNLLWRFRHLCK